MSIQNYDERWFFPSLDRPGMIRRWIISTFALIIFTTLTSSPDSWVDTFLSLLKSWGSLSLFLLLICGYGSKFLKPLPIGWTWVTWAVVTISLSLTISVIDLDRQNIINNMFLFLFERTFRDIFFVVFLLFIFDGQHRRGSASWVKARLDILQARMRPHFLFNTLNGLSELVYIDQEKAEKALLDLADLSRAMIEQQPEISAEKEKNNAMAYLSLEKLRLEDRLQVIWDWEIPKNTKIPSLLLQPLLENSIKHGIEPSLRGGNIEIKGWIDTKNVYIKIQNPCYEGDDKKFIGHGITLPNIAERLQWLYPSSHKFRTKVENGMFQVFISFPLSQIH